MPTVTGQLNDYRRIRTGLPSLDLLLKNSVTGEVGYPIRTISEIYGYAGHGKSTLTQYLAGVLSHNLGKDKIYVADLEGAYDETHLLNNLEGAGFDGEVELMPSLDRSHEDILEDLVRKLKKPDTGAIILDSLGAVMSQAEVDNPIGSANWGKRAQIINQFCRKGMMFLRNAKDPAVCLVVNHQYPNMGGLGHKTPGGEGKEFAASLRLTLWKAEMFSNGIFLVKVKAEKMRYGGTVPKQTALVCIIPGMGVSPHLTIMFDAAVAGLIERTKSGTIKVAGKSIGRIGTILQKVRDGNVSILDPVVQLADKITNVEEDDGDTDSTD